MKHLHCSPDTTWPAQSTPVSSPVYTRSVFVAHKLVPSDFGTLRLRDVRPDWMPGILITCFILIAWAQVFYFKRIRQIFQAPFSRRFMNQLTRDGNLFTERVSLAFGLVYVLIFSLFIFLCNQYILHLAVPGVEGFTLYAIICLLFTCYVGAKAAVVNLLGAIFRTRETTADYQLNLLVFALIIGPVMLPGLVLAIYLNSPLMTAISAILAGVLLAFRFLRGFFIGLELRKFSYLFLFVYLCSLEILPLAVLAKLLLSLTATGHS